MEDILKLIGEVGLPIAGSFAMGYFIFLTIKQMMAGVVGQVKTLTSFCEALTTRARVMSNEMIIQLTTKADARLLVSSWIIPFGDELGHIFRTPFTFFI